VVEEEGGGRESVEGESEVEEEEEAEGDGARTRRGFLLRNLDWAL
jgi:hypothetical protein